MSDSSNRKREMESVELVTENHPAVILAEGVDRSAAFAVSRDDARAHQLLPFRWEAGYLCVAVAGPPSYEARSILDSIGPVRLYHAALIDILVAQWHIYGSASDTPPQFGDLALRHGMRVDELNAALSLQQNNGAKVGAIAVAQNSLTSWQVAEVLSEQTGIPAVNLMNTPPPPDAEIADVWALLDEHDWRNCDMVPIKRDGSHITVAVTNPFDTGGQEMLSRKSGGRVSAVITGHRDILHVLDYQYRERNLQVSRTFLMRRNPDDSATRTVTRAQKVAAVLILAIVAAALILQRTLTVSVISSALVCVYSILVLHRIWIIRKGTIANTELAFTAEQIAEIKDTDLPTYTILIPARDEASVLGVLTEALSRLDYPKDRLDVKLLLEDDDVDTITAAQKANLPGFMEIVVVPAADPRTKPKALNYGLQRARGQFVTIYDAEDLPEPTQLKKALLAFKQGNENLACVQAKLSYFNVEQNLLTRWFTAEYSAWFNLLLPALHYAALPIPLGGTSNHFRTDVLRQVGAWDPHNVTEDADLGIRLHKAGYRTAVMDSLTYEEANSDFVNWIRQRSRWIKGYLQTWLVHMRHPIQLRQQLGRRGFWGFQLTILGTPLMFILNPIYWLITSLWFMTHWGLIPHLFPPGIYYLGMINLLVGNFVFAYLNAVGSAKQGSWNLVPYAILTPIYWTMMSLASWKALLQLWTRPSHWEKTHHGLTNWSTVHPDLKTLAQGGSQEETA